MRKLFWTLLFLGACTLDGGKKVPIEELDFSTTDDSEIFFKNIRQSSYDREEIEQMNVYRLGSRLANPKTLNIAIAWSWIGDMAYVLLEPVTPFESGAQIGFDSLQFIIDLEEFNTAAEQTEVSTMIYNSFIDRDPVLFRQSDTVDWDTLFIDPKEREVFRVTMSDYFRLTNNF